MSELIVKLFDDDKVFETLRTDWQRLYQRSGSAPFLSWEWAAAWFRFFGRTHRPFILTAFSGDTLVALLPLYLENKKILRIRANQLAFIGTEIGGAAYLDVLAAPSERSEATDAFLRYLHKCENVDLFELEGIASSSPFLKAIERHSKDLDLKLHVVPHDVCQVASISGSERGAFLKQIFNDTAKKKIKRLERLGGFAFKRITDPAEVAAAFRRFAALHDKNWGERGGSDVTSTQPLLDFHLTVIGTSSAANRVFFDELWVEGDCIASLYGFCGEKTYFYYSSGYDERLSKLSPMATLYNLSIKNGLENEVSTFDFLRGDYAYKNHWINSKNQLVTVWLGRKNPRAAVHLSMNRFWQFGKTSLKIVLPPDILTRLKERRRLWKSRFSHVQPETHSQPQHEGL